MMPTIRIDDDVFQGLKSIAEPFIDTPNSVIRRLLQEYGASNQTKEGLPSSANVEVKRDSVKTSTSLTPQPIYEGFLLYVLANEFNGRGGKLEVTKAVVEMMRLKGFIGQAELDRVTTGETRAENTVAWGRNALKDRGLISRLSPRGIWELTPEGMEKSKSTALPDGTA